MNAEVSHYDLHIHGWRSPDSKEHYRDIFNQAKAQGIAGIAITDHNTNAGYRRATELAEETGVLLLGSSAEITTRIGSRFPHMLAINVPHKDLKNYLKPQRYFHLGLPTPEAFLTWMKNEQFPNSLVVIAHPAVPEGNINSLSADEIKQFHAQGLLEGAGIEILNKHPGKRDAQRRKLAEELGLAMIGNSDAHKSEHVGRISTEIPGKQQTVAEVIFAINNRQSRPSVKDDLFSKKAKKGS